LIERIDSWTETLAIPRLSEYGIFASDLDRIAQSTGNKNNPGALSEEEIKDLASMRL